MKTSLLLLLVFTVFLAVSSSPSVYAVDRMDVLLVSRTKAVVRIDGKRQVLRLGEKSNDGYKLLSIEGDEIVVEKNGQVHQLNLGNSIEKQSGAPKKKHLYVYLNARGRYLTKGSINGYYVDFVVDTGADTVALSSREADRIGLDYRMKGRKSRSVTASGVAPSYEIMLRSVKVGDIELFNVNATVIKGDFPVDVLLGMSYLKRIKIEHTPTAMILKEK